MASGTAKLFIPGTTASATQTFTLFSHQSGTVGGGGNMCQRVLSGIEQDGGVMLSRGISNGNGSACSMPDIGEAIGHRVAVDGIGRVQRFVTTLPAGTSAVSIPIAAVDATRTLVFARTTPAAADRASARPRRWSAFPSAISSARTCWTRRGVRRRRVLLARDSSQADTRWSSFVVELGP